MIISDFIIVNGIMAMTGGAGVWIQFHWKTTAEVTALVAGWGASEAARMWFNTDTNQLEMWDGTSVVILG